jgi:hypothetical protein
MSIMAMRPPWFGESVHTPTNICQHIGAENTAMLGLESAPTPMHLFVRLS